MKKLLYVFLLIPFYGCVGSSPDNGGGGGGSPGTSTCTSVVAEIGACTTNTTYSSFVTVTGDASFKKRKIIEGSTNNTLVLGDADSIELPIRYAEIRVLNSSGTVVQCGMTDTNGNLKATDATSSLKIPDTVGNYTIQVLARGNKTIPATTANIYASVKKDICTNEVHSISTSISSVGSGTIAVAGTELIATAKESVSADIPGAAFNIYNNLVTTYEYLGNNTGSANLACLNPVAAPKLQIFWKAGFNPAQYIYVDEDPVNVPNISFYLRTYNELYINGGKLGNVKTNADTDHFDDAVIIHEIGHHIEDACGKMESPGGSHNGLFRVDPRLAWSEGWGNYLGAHIIKNNLSKINNDPNLATELSNAGALSGWSFYLDTEGYVDGISQGQELIRFDLSLPGGNPGIVATNYYYDRVNPTDNPGEGHFREVSIARSLFKSSNTCASNICSDGSYFDEMWLAFRNMSATTYPFRSSARFYDRLYAVFSGSWPAAIGAAARIDEILDDDEAQQLPGNSDYVIGGNLTWPTYGTKLVRSGVACTTPLEIRPRRQRATPLAPETSYTTQVNLNDDVSDQRFSNHFFWVETATTLNGGAVTKITLTATKVAGTNTIDFDLILYAEGYRFPEDSCTGTSGGICTTYAKVDSAQFARKGRTTANVEEISSLNGLGGNYLLNVRAYTAGQNLANDNRYTYELTTDTGEYLCPSPTF